MTEQIENKFLWDIITENLQQHKYDLMIVTNGGNGVHKTITKCHHSTVAIVIDAPIDR